MNFAEYTQLALRTKAPHNTRDHTMMGLFGEAGEVVDLIKKVVAHGHPITPELCAKMRKEIGDTLWYIALGADEDNVLLEEAFQWKKKPTISLLDLADLAKEIRADVYNIEDISKWYDVSCAYENLVRVLAEIAEIFGATLEQCAIENIEKLRKRYPNGFSSEASQARVDVVAKKFVLMRKHHRDKVPWYLCERDNGTFGWTTIRPRASIFSTADDAQRAAGGFDHGYAYHTIEVVE